MNDQINDSWETRIDLFSKITGLTVNKVEELLNKKPFEINKDTPFALEMLSDEEVIPFGDMRKIFSDDAGISLPKLRLGLKYLRGSKEKRQEATTNVDPNLVDLQTKYGIKTRFEDLGPEELIPYYDPSKNNRISDTLKKKFGTNKVIAFKPDTSEVAKEETINYMCDLQNGLPEEDAIYVDGELVKLYAIGNLPNQIIDEDPMFPESPLKRNRSIINRINWEGIGLEVRQFVRLLVNDNEIDPTNKIGISMLVPKIKEGLKDLKEIYPETFMKFKDLKSKNELPKLIISMDELKPIKSKQNNPFSINKTY